MLTLKLIKTICLNYNKENNSYEKKLFEIVQ